MRILFLSLIAVLSLTACRESDANDGLQKTEVIKPYKATTIDECIQEKECVWYAFQEIVLDPHFTGKWNRPLKLIPRWKEDIRISFLNPPDPLILKNIEEDIKQLKTVFPYKIGISNEESNFYIFLLENFNLKNSKNLKKEVIKNSSLNENEFLLLISAANFNNNHCSNYKKRKQGFIDTVGIFVNLSKNSDKTCFRMNLFTALNFSHQGAFKLGLSDFKPSIENASKVTDLHLLVAKIFYHPDFPEKTNYEISEKAFNKIYPKIKEKKR